MKCIKIAAGLAFVAFMVSGCGGAIDAKIGGTVSGLAGGTSVELLNNGMDPLTVTANGDFTFPSGVSANSSYNVTVNSQPTGETCTVTNGSGVISNSGGDVTNVQVNCAAGSATTSAVSASVSGLALGATLVLLDNGGDNLTVIGTTTTASGGTVTKLFSTPLTLGANFNVTVGMQPSTQTCVVTNGVGRIPTTGSAPPAIVTCA